MVSPPPVSETGGMRCGAMTALLTVLCVWSPAQATEPYADAMVYSAPESSQSDGWVPSGGGVTAFGEVSIVRERFFDVVTGPPPSPNNSGLWTGLDSANTHRGGLYAQSFLVRVGPVSNCSSDLEASFRLGAGAGATAVGS